jgi:hypothetical protein
MPDHARPDDVPAEFERALELFAGDVAALADRAARALTHGELEEQIISRMRELGQAMMQACLNLGAADEPRRRDVTDADGWSAPGPNPATNAH